MPPAAELVAGPPCGAFLPATDAGCERVAARFRALSEPTRLKIVRRLALGEACVGEIVAAVGGTQANVSKHLGVLRSSGALTRTRRGPRTIYAIADPALLRICSIVCEGVERGARESAASILGLAAQGL